MVVSVRSSNAEVVRGKREVRSEGVSGLKGKYLEH